MSDPDPENTPPKGEGAAPEADGAGLNDEAAKSTDSQTPEGGDEGAGTDQAADETSESAEGGPATYEELQSEVATLKDQLLRALAETENIRRRGERERADLAKYAPANFARDILSVADNLQRALESVSDDARAANEELNNFYAGIEITAKELPAGFERFGIKPIDALGKRFDHNFHQAMFELDDPSQPAGTVVQVIQTGYMIHDRLLRPAMVGVAKGGPKPDAATDDETALPPEAGEVAEAEKAATEGHAAYEKRADAVDGDGETTGPKLDTEL